MFSQPASEAGQIFSDLVIADLITKVAEEPISRAGEELAAQRKQAPKKNVQSADEQTPRERRQNRVSLPSMNKCRWRVRQWQPEPFLIE